MKGTSEGKGDLSASKAHDNRDSKYEEAERVAVYAVANRTFEENKKLKAEISRLITEIARLSAPSNLGAPQCTTTTAQPQQQPLPVNRFVQQQQQHEKQIQSQQVQIRSQQEQLIGARNVYDQLRQDLEKLKVEVKSTVMELELKSNVMSTLKRGAASLAEVCVVFETPVAAVRLTCLQLGDEVDVEEQGKAVKRPRN